MKKGSYILIVFGALITLFFIVNNRNNNLITSEYNNGQIITKLNVRNTDNIYSTEFRYETSFLEQYTNVNPEVMSYLFNNYEETHTYDIDESILQGKKDYILVQVILSYDDGSTEIIGKAVTKNIKEKVYDDYVISPHVEDDGIYYRVEGTARVPIPCIHQSKHPL